LSVLAGSYHRLAACYGLSVSAGRLCGMAISDPKSDLRRYLQNGRDAVLWKLDGLSEYDARRPLTPTGTNLLGLIKHLTGSEFGYFGEVFGRPAAQLPPWADEELLDRHPTADMWATFDEAREYIIGWYRRAWRTPTRHSMRWASMPRAESRGGASAAR
jgi:hypothetical protein